jgi:hypothetical protein
MPSSPARPHRPGPGGRPRTARQGWSSAVRSAGRTGARRCRSGTWSADARCRGTGRHRWRRSSPSPGHDSDRQPTTAPRRITRTGCCRTPRSRRGSASKATRSAGAPSTRASGQPSQVRARQDPAPKAYSAELKAARAAIHVDEDRKTAEAERLVALGAQVVDEHADRGPRTIVMQDPEGNEFCLHCQLP